MHIPALQSMRVADVGCKSKRNTYSPCAQSDRTSRCTSLAAMTVHLLEQDRCYEVLLLADDIKSAPHRFCQCLSVRITNRPWYDCNSPFAGVMHNACRYVQITCL